MVISKPIYFYFDILSEFYGFLKIFQNFFFEKM